MGDQAHRELWSTRGGAHTAQRLAVCRLRASPRDWGVIAPGRGVRICRCPGGWNHYAEGVFRDLMRDKAKTMPTDPDAADVTALRVWHCNYASLALVTQYQHLRTLVVATYPDADLEPVASLEDLEYLSLLHLPGVTDLAPLARLTNLRTLRLSTLPSWDSSGKVTQVDSLRPLAMLPKLTRLELFGVRPASKSLSESPRVSWRLDYLEPAPVGTGVSG